jgi:DNA-binding transcriptional regulator YhcF (GntR family)
VLRRIDARSPVPRYVQIADGIRLAAVTGELPAGAALPSVRRLAARLAVNPATIVQAYRRLRAEGLAESRRGAGTFVRPLSGPRRVAARRREAAALVRRLLREAADRGLTRQDVEAAFRRETRGGRR